MDAGAGEVGRGPEPPSTGSMRVQKGEESEEEGMRGQTTLFLDTG